MTPLLAGKRIVITRAHHQAAPLARDLEALGASVISIPLIEVRPPQSFQPLDKALAKIQKYDWLILTSVNGVHALRKRLDKAGMSPSALRHLSIVAIGPATCDELSALGLTVKVVPEEYVAESVVRALQGQVKGKSILLVRAKIARDVIPKALRDAGAEVDVAEAYETVLPINAAKRLAEHLENGRLQADAITFTSSSTVRNFAAALSQGLSPKSVLQDVLIASIGPVTSATLGELGLKADVEGNPYTIPGLVNALTNRLRNPFPADIPPVSS
ncbi:MAG TPA: uroporphyrinogen-III synthase [Terriglobales bacterium]|nr:uroporphyrinogen-III synthase [Terriglobales bacterium]